MTTPARPRSARSLHSAMPADPSWYKDAIIYEVHVRAFYDSNGDGIGDFRGLTEKLGYLQDLGVTTVWLLPFYPSPLKDDGYDTADYTSVHHSYGALADVKAFVAEAHRRGLRVITELVCNHTSDQHPWFQRARGARRGTSVRDFYVWGDDPDRYRQARIIFKDFESSNWSWDPVAEAYYWHRFYSHQPDLNYDNPRVHRAIFRVLDFWLRMGIDGLRLDAVPYLYEREGTNCENLPETHQFLKKLRRHVDEQFADRMLLAEANQWPEEAVTYFGDGDECHMAFHFPVMPRMFMALRMEDRFPIIDILDQTPPIPDNAQWAMFLRNHDELTLEMVTDEERDYMYKVYGRDPQMRINLGIRRRLAPLLGNERRRMELMNALLFSLPGTPVIYYGDEIGMGDNIYLGDRNGVRTPMQWSSDRNAGFSRANPQQLYLPVISDPEYHYETVQVQAQQANPHSLLWWMKRLIALRKRYKAFGRGSLEFLYPENRKVLAFVRRLEGETILVVANMSRFVQYAELALPEFRGLVPVELFGQTEFPQVRDQPYLLTLGPHAFYWFALVPEKAATIQMPSAPESRPAVPALSFSGDWRVIAETLDGSPLANILPEYIRARRWFGRKSRRIKFARVIDAVQVSPPGDGYLNLVQLDYTEGDPDVFVLPVAFATGDHASRLLRESPWAVIVRLEGSPGSREGVIYDALVEPDFSRALLSALGERRRLRGREGSILPVATRVLRHSLIADGELEPSVLRAEQSNSSVTFGDRLIFKLFRRLEAGVNPEQELGRFLTERGYSHVPPFVGAMEYRGRRGEPMTVGLLQGLVRNEGDAWQYTLGVLGRYFENVAASQEQPPGAPATVEEQIEAAEQELPKLARSTIGEHLGLTRLLGQRTAEMHLALSSASGESAFTPEPFTSYYQRALYQSLRTLTIQVFQSLRRSAEEVRALTHDLPGREGEVLSRFQTVLEGPISAMRIRCHGDYHLGQVLFTGHDFVIIDFEGEPAKPLSQRKIKRSPLVDVAGMLRSFHYVSHSPLFGQVEGAMVRPEDLPILERWASYWTQWVATAFLQGYLSAAKSGSFMPASTEELSRLMGVYLLEKAVYEVGYELNNRPTWVGIPARGVLDILGQSNGGRNP